MYGFLLSPQPIEPTVLTAAYSFRSRAPRREYREPTRESREPPRDRKRDYYDDYSQDNRRSGRHQGPYGNQARSRDDYNNYNGRNDRGRRPRPDPRRGRERYVDQRTKPVTELPEKLRSRLENLANVPSLDEIAIENSRWGVRVEGFEDVLAVRAKLSGLFPLPGYPRPRDYTKLFPSVRSKLPYYPEDPDGDTHIEPFQSLAARTLIVDINFSFDPQLVSEYIANFLRGLDTEVTGLDSVKLAVKHNDIFTIEFKNHECATIALALTSQPVTIVDDGQPVLLTLSISRPKEYTVQSIQNTNTADEFVADSPRKITLRTKEDSDTKLRATLESVSGVKLLFMLREIGTKKFTGIAFVEFNDSPSDILDKLNEIESIESAWFSCETSSVQNRTAEFENLKLMAKANGATEREELKCIVLANMFLPRELYDQSNYKFILDDIRQEAEQFGDLKSVKIPKPDAGEEHGVGKAYIEFGSQEAATKAMEGLAGRFYNDRTVLCSYYSWEDYNRDFF